VLDIAMVTYNQENCIAQAIESVLMQKVNFPYKLVIGEDCSSDGTHAICQLFASKYPNTIKLITHDTNQGLVKNYQSVFKACTGKYIAILEGDDFWTDEYKLQKQVDILEKYPEIGMVHANFTFYNNISHKIYKPPEYAIMEGKIFYALFRGNYIGPLTVVIRKELIDRHVDFNVMIREGYKTIDFFIWLEVAYNSSVAYIPDVVGAYRKIKGSISNPEDFDKLIDFTSTTIKILDHITNKYKITELHVLDTKNAINYNMMLMAIHYNSFNRIKQFRQLSQPKGVIERIRYLMASNILFIKIGKLLGIYN
jgi:glycosyltransferase involved in cell wall biosynthesis